MKGDIRCNITFFLFHNFHLSVVFEGLPIIVIMCFNTCVVGPSCRYLFLNVVTTPYMLCSCTIKALKVCKGQFFCGPDDADTPCVDKSKICDGHNDCPNSMDERHCGKSKICDGRNDCSNGVEKMPCSTSSIFCGNNDCCLRTDEMHYCKSKICGGNYDCSNRIHEMHCDNCNSGGRNSDCFNSIDVMHCG